MNKFIEKKAEHEKCSAFCAFMNYCQKLCLLFVQVKTITIANDKIQIQRKKRG